MITMYRNKKRIPSFAHFAKEEIPNRVISARDAIDGWTFLDVSRKRLFAASA
jgi:hypothetical protein